MLECISQEFTAIVKDFWNKYFKFVNITKCFKAWWNKKCNRDLATYQIFRRRIDWIKYKKSVKRVFFDNRIQEIASTNKRPWNLINWVKK